MRQNTHSRKRGFTLLELTIAMMIAVFVGSMVLAILNQQLAFLRIFRLQGFLTEEAPIVSMYVNRLVGKADRFRLHESVADALSGTNPQVTNSPVCLLNFRQPDGSMRASILSFEDRGSGPALYYYVIPEDAALGEPDWAVTNRPVNVEFFMEQGILRTQLTGPQGEQITYSGAMQ